MSLGARLKKLRVSRELTLEQLANLINESEEGLSANKSMVSKWENDKISPMNNYLSAYAKIFKVSLNYLLGVEEEEDENIITYRVDARGLSKEQRAQLERDLTLVTEFFLTKLKESKK